MKTTRNIVVVVAAVFVFSTVMRGNVSSSWRRITEGQDMPEISALDTQGHPFVYTRSSGKVLLLAFLSSEQKRSQRAVEDIFKVLFSIPEAKLASLQVAFVLQNVEDKGALALIQEEAPSMVRILGDDQHHIWGKLGVIATPTVFISDHQGKVCCAKPGYAYDAEPVIKSRLFQALDIPCKISPDEASTVRTVANTTVSAKAKRHLKTSKLLMQKGRVRSAIIQAQMAYQIDPNSQEVALELGELLYRAGWSGQASKAIQLVCDVSGHSHQDKARVNLILGWAHRELGKLKEAETFLNEGIKHDPTSPRLFFELGRIYQKRQDTENAMKAYFRALELVYQEEKT